MTQRPDIDRLRSVVASQSGLIPSRKLEGLLDYIEEVEAVRDNLVKHRDKVIDLNRGLVRENADLKARAEAAERAVARVREVVETCTDKFLTMALFEALDGDTHG